MTHENYPGGERFEFNATPEQAGEVFSQIGRILSDLPLDVPRDGIGPANKIRTYENATLAYYPDGIKFLPDDISTVYGVIAVRADDGIILQYVVHKELDNDFLLERHVLAGVENDTSKKVPKFGPGRTSRETDHIFTQIGLRRERELGFTGSSAADANDLIQKLSEIPVLPSRPTRFG